VKRCPAHRADGAHGMRHSSRRPLSGSAIPLGQAPSATVDASQPPLEDLSRPCAGLQGQHPFDIPATPKPECNAQSEAIACRAPLPGARVTSTCWPERSSDRPQGLPIGSTRFETNRTPRARCGRHPSHVLDPGPGSAPSAPRSSRARAGRVPIPGHRPVQRRDRCPVGTLCRRPRDRDRARHP
jgi:hypothetical protein